MTIRKAVEANMAWSLTLSSYSESGGDMVSAGVGEPGGGGESGRDRKDWA